MFKSVSDKKLGLILVLLAAMFWGYVGVPTKHLADLGFDNYTISFFKTSIPAIFYLIYSFKKDPSLFKVDKKGVLFFIIYGMVVIAGCFIAFNVTINLLPLALATMFLYTSQIWVVTISYFIFKEKFTLQKSISMLLILIGCFMMCEVHKLGNFSLSTKGIFWGLISGFTFALQIILAKVSNEKYHYNHNTLLTYSFLFAAIFLFPFMDMKNNIHIFKSSNNLFFLFKNIFWSVIGTLIANTAYVKSVQYIEASIASMVSSLELVIASILGFIVFNQALNLVQILGMALILVSIILLEMKKSDLIKLFKKTNKNLKITSDPTIETEIKL
ncbi:EamA family transporter [Clostridium sporogenes]|uniref:DMT family transporter n=1 Tax=Clostridium sporogenes TaxID=1509 RepID=UPI000E19FB6C|nr:DMT family transporter [Clostridium sporogenes]NFT03330.1 EamA family transporter [Clostridium sporogenes]NFT32559.1 EamA family transporter [Clostridium sporogenes]NFT38330.1 EamA family transporter [Clostridium sporogenes]NFT53398.1 EamA family transporter [Clostridium sporogenes]NFT74603.1 EamA family transporter [Clostridium sporogenes]